MSNILRLVPAAVIGIGALFLTPTRAAEPDPKIITYTLPENIKWRKNPGSDTAIIQGDPSKPGIYIQLIRWYPGNNSRPHTHRTDRYITVLSGTWYLGWGMNYDPKSMVPMKAGTYVVHHANQPHYDGAKDEECVLYVVGMGPLVTTTAGKEPAEKDR